MLAKIYIVEGETRGGSSKRWKREGRIGGRGRTAMRTGVLHRGTYYAVFRSIIDAPLIRMSRTVLLSSLVSRRRVETGEERKAEESKVKGEKGLSNDFLRKKKN